MKYKTGEITREKILNVCKELFYEKGYAAATYVEICEKAEVNPPTIKHHFGSKRAIAGEIYVEFMAEIVKYMSRFTAGIDDLFTRDALSIINMFYQVYNNENIKRFVIDIYRELIPNEYMRELYKEFYTNDVLFYKTPIDPKKIDFVAISTIGMEQEIILNCMEQFSFQELTRYYIEAVFKLLEAEDYINIPRLLNKAFKFYSTLNIDYGYFEKFAYKSSEEI